MIWITSLFVIFMLDIIFLPACLVWRCALPSITKLIHKILGTLAKGKKKKQKLFSVPMHCVVPILFNDGGERIVKRSRKQTLSKWVVYVDHGYYRRYGWTQQT
jgi:hypothetical protein